MPLSRYREKRSADRTTEPFGTGRVAAEWADRGMFVIQKHSARRLHYDFRLEMEGVLRSWAVPKGPSLNPADKRLAVMVEDHPIEYGDYEGVIPQGNYGAGSVIVWDRGEYSVIDPAHGDAAQAVRKGKLDLELRGYKLRGAYTLVRTRRTQKSSSGDKEQWLLIKKRDPHAASEDVTELHPRSVLSGLTVEEMRDASAVEQQVVALLKERKAPAYNGEMSFKAFPLTLAKLTEEPFDGDGWLFEIKYDGVRALAIRDGAHTRLFARSGIEITARYPELRTALDALPCEHFAIDAEIVALGEEGRPSFELLQRRMHLSDPRDIARASLAVPVVMFAFDLLVFAGFDLRRMALEERKQILARLIRGEGPVRYCDHVIARGRDFHQAAAGAQLEGIVAKRRDSNYAGVRTDNWLKIKCPSTQRFVIGGWTDPEGSRTHFGALLIGQYDADGKLRFVTRAGTGFNDERLREIYRLLKERAVDASPFRPAKGDQPAPPRGSHFCRPELVCEVRFTEFTNAGGLRHPSFQGMVANADPRECIYETPHTDSDRDGKAESRPGDPAPMQMKKSLRRETASASSAAPPAFTVTNPDKIFWPAEKYTKGDLVEYYESVAKWMLPYLKDRPVMMVRYPDGIEGKSFYQKDAPGFAPEWMRKERIYSEDSQREIAYFVLESAEALGYIANLGTIPIHIWSSRIGSLEHPDWLLFDIDPKGSTTPGAIAVAREVALLLRRLGLRPVIKTSGQMGLHVVVGLKPRYTYEQARAFSELVARVVVARIPELATINRNVHGRKGRVYIDYLQLGHGKTIAAPFAVRPITRAPVSAPIDFAELQPELDPGDFNIKSMPRRMARLRRDPFAGALDDPQTLEEALPKLEAEVGAKAG